MSDIAEEIKRMTDEKKKEIRESIESAQRRVLELANQLAEVEPKVTELLTVKAALEKAGFAPEIGTWTDSLNLHVKQKQLTDVYRVVGRLDGANKEVSLVSARAKKVQVVLHAVKYPFVRVRFEAKLKDGGKCKIVKEKTRARTSFHLACSV